MKEIYTSYFANIRKLPRDIVPIGISVGKNKQFPGLKYDQRMAPSWPMLKMPREQYDIKMAERLARLDAREVYNSLPEKAALICYEKYNDWCHRRMVAEWLESELGIIVPEYGLKREESWPYKELGPEKKGLKRITLVTSYGTTADTTIIDEFNQVDDVPEAVRKRQESYKKDHERMDLFNYQKWED